MFQRALRVRVMLRSLSAVVVDISMNQMLSEDSGW